MPINRKFLDTLLDLCNNGRSGVLRIERGADKKQLVLNGGSLVFAESNVPDEHLARIIVKLNLLPRTKVNEIATLMKAERPARKLFSRSPAQACKTLKRRGMNKRHSF